MKSPLSHLFSRLNNSNSSSCSSEVLFSSHFISLSNSTSCSEGPWTEPSTQGADSAVRHTRAESLPQSCYHTTSDVGQDTVGLFGHLGTLVVLIQLAANQHSQVQFCWASFQPLFPRRVLLNGVFMTKVQNQILSCWYFTNFRYNNHWLDTNF